MKTKILETGCQNYKILEKNIKETVKDLKAKVKKNINNFKLIEYGIMLTLTLIVDKKIISHGKVF